VKISLPGKRVVASGLGVASSLGVVIVDPVEIGIVFVGVKVGSASVAIVSVVVISATMAVVGSCEAW
jgi:hypothetical protein